ncbi:MAG: hypothetical protein AB7L91_18010 [Dehalococcoidia bacterium]
MNTSPLGYALSAVSAWVVLALGLFYAYLATLGGPNLIIHTIGATALITTSICVFAARYGRALDTRARVLREHDDAVALIRSTTDELLAQSRQLRRDLTAAADEAALRAAAL